MKVALAIPLLAHFLLGCSSATYLAAQGQGQLRLLRARRHIGDVLADPAVGDETKRRLAIAAEARAFGVRALGLHGGDAFTRFLDTGGAPIAWNVEAAPPDRLEPYVHHFPLVGAVPYLGFFHEADARREEAQLRARGLDTFVRPVVGYSTLGILADPVYSSMLEGPDARIVEVVLHEMTHGTVFLAGHAEWNESLATFVGLRGAAAFFALRGHADAAKAVLDEATTRERDEQAFSQFLAPLVAELKALYATHRPLAATLALRAAVFARARREYIARFPQRPGRKPGLFATELLNNAVVLSFAIYHAGAPAHRRVFLRVGCDLAKMIRVYRHAVEDESDPLGYLRTL